MHSRLVSDCQFSSNFQYIHYWTWNIILIDLCKWKVKNKVWHLELRAKFQKLLFFFHVFDVFNVFWRHTDWIICVSEAYIFLPCLGDLQCLMKTCGWIRLDAFQKLVFFFDVFDFLDVLASLNNGPQTNSQCATCEAL